jgi:hypothetical protein
MMPVAAALVCGGCSQEPVLPVTYPVTGKVIYQGKPVAGAVVMFHRKGADVTEGASIGICDTDGTFELSTFGDRDGVPEGDYQVAVRWAEVVGGSLSEPEYGREKLPPKFNDPNTSGLFVKVNPKSNQLEPFVLKL